MQDDYVNINLEEAKTSNSGLWQSQICVDASTDIAHTENECTYSLIQIPNQDLSLGKKAYTHLYFMLQLNQTNQVIIPYQIKLCVFSRSITCKACFMSFNFSFDVLLIQNLMVSTVRSLIYSVY